MNKDWTTEKINKGFEKFITTHGRLPKAAEIDELDYLPSSRYIQKRFGGLQALRKELGYSDTHFGKGSYRRTIASDSGARNKEITLDMHQWLQTIFSNHSIQLEKTFHGNHRINFYIQTDECNFGIDIFYAQTMRTLQSSVNIKMKKYTHFTKPLYLTVANDSFCQTELNSYSQKRKKSFPENIRLVTLKTLRKTLESMCD
jgi:hypothetical protein